MREIKSFTRHCAVEAPRFVTLVCFELDVQTVREAEGKVDLLFPAESLVQSDGRTVLLYLEVVRVESEIVSFTLSERFPCWSWTRRLGVEIIADDLELTSTRLDQLLGERNYK